MEIQMSDEEVRLFTKYIQRCTCYFEFGIGGSTIHTFIKTEAKIRGIESDKEWVNRVQSEVEDDRLVVSHVDIGKTKEFGHPVSDSNKVKFPAYSMSIHSTDINPDFILIDGRFRVACLIQSIIFSVNRKIDPIISLHDCQRSYYDDGIKSLRLIERVNNLAMFRIDSNSLCISDMEHLYNKYKYLSC
jgi:protein O-GlcNAc transferase